MLYLSSFKAVAYEGTIFPQNQPIRQTLRQQVQPLLRVEKKTLNGKGLSAGLSTSFELTTFSGKIK